MELPASDSKRESIRCALRPKDYKHLGGQFAGLACRGRTSINGNYQLKEFI